MNYKRMLLAGSLLLGAFAMRSQAQSVEGTDYYLPKTLLRFTVKVEKKQYTPGKLAPYASRFLRTDVELEPTTTYRLLGVDMATYALPDTSRHFTLIVDKKHSINKDVSYTPLTLPTNRTV